MKILVFSDIHSDLRALQKLMEIDAGHYFAAGDMVSWARGLDAVGPILQRRAPNVWVIPGNHESERNITDLCDRYGLRNFHGQTTKLDGFHIAGLGYSNITPFDTPGEYPESEFKTHLSGFAALSPLIMVCHCPPKSTKLDRAGEGKHFGSPAVRDFIEQHQPYYFFCGHIHEAEGSIDTIGRTVAVNVGKRGYLLDLAKIEVKT